jgi:hypothetical protein
VEVLALCVQQLLLVKHTATGQSNYGEGLLYNGQLDVLVKSQRSPVYIKFGETIVSVPSQIYKTHSVAFWVITPCWYVGSNVSEEHNVSIFKVPSIILPQNGGSKLLQNAGT